MENNNSKCPLCGHEFFLGDDGGIEATCPSCGEKIRSLQAKRYFSTIYENKEELKEAHGEDYHKVMMLIAEAEDLSEAERYDEAEERIGEALSLTDTDYRVFMTMVRIKTKNYTDLADESHKEYLNKAIAVADADGKKDITKRYKTYYMKTKLSSDELKVYSAEESKLRRKKLESALKSLIPDFMVREKRNKILLVLFPILIAVGIATSIVFIILDFAWLSVLGVAMTLAGYIVFRTWFVGREKVRAFNSLLDLFDFIDGKEYNDRTLVDVYGMMYKIYARFADNDPVVTMSDDVSKLDGYLADLRDDKLDEFITNNKFFADNMPRETD